MQWFGADVAIKVVSIDREKDLDAHALERFRLEVRIQRSLSFHPNIGE